MPHRFTGCELRTTDVAAARAFYDDVIGDVPGAITALPAQAALRGAPPHWLALVRVPDVAIEEAAWALAGAARLGPVRDDGSVVLRDPFGAVVGLSPGPGSGPRAWHELHVHDPAHAFALYAVRLGWSRASEPEADEAITFSWGVGAVGRITALARAPEVHPHWVFYDEVDGLDGAIARTRACGGKVIDVRASAGARVAYCEDPQGAVFGLRSR